MAGRKYSDELLDRAAAMREDGASYGTIAQALGMSHGAVYWHSLRLGADRDVAQAPPKANRGPMLMKRGNHKVRRFTEAEDRSIIEMELSGKSIAEISRALGRKHNSMLGRMMTLAHQQEREASA